MGEQPKEEKKNNKGVMVWLILVIVIIVLIILGALYFRGKGGTQNNTPIDNNATSDNGGNSNSNVQINSTTDMENLINQVYEGQETVLPTSLMTQVVDMSNIDIVTSYTGLTSTENIDAVVVSEPMMSSQAYSFVLVKVKDGADANAIAKEMSEKVDTRKWICVEAEKLYATSSGNLVALVMASDEWATPVYNSLKEILGTTNEEYVKDNTQAATDQMLEQNGVIEY